MEFLQTIQNTPLPLALVIIGLLVVLAALIGKVGAYLEVPQDKAKPVLGVGALLVVMGVMLYALPAMTPKTVQANALSPAPGAPKTSTAIDTASPLLQRLATANIMPTGSEAPPNQRLMMEGAMKSDPSLQALGETSLRVLSGRKFKDAVHLDTVFGYYKKLVNPNEPNPDKWHPNPEQCTDSEKLKEACLKHWNEQHGNALVTAFDQIVE